MLRELREGEGQRKNYCVGLKPVPPLVEVRITQLATASFRANIHLNATIVTFLSFPTSYWILFSGCCAVWFFLPHAMLFPIFPPNCCWRFLHQCLFIFLLIWSRNHDAKLFRFLCFMLRCWTLFCTRFGLHSTTLFDALHLTLRCWNFMNFFYRMCCCWMSSIHFMLHHLILFLWCKPPGTSCESDWCPLHNVTLRVSVRDATLFDFIQVILRRFTTFHTSCCLAFSIPIFFSEFDQVFSMLFDFVINTLRCLIVSNSLRPWPAGVMLVSVVYVMVHVAPDLRDATLFDLLHLLLRFLGLPTLCNVA